MFDSPVKSAPFAVRRRVIRSLWTIAVLWFSCGADSLLAQTTAPPFPTGTAAAADPSSPDLPKTEPPKPEVPAEGSQPLSREILEKLRARVETHTELTEEQKAAALEQVQQALSHLRLVQEFVSREQVDKEKLAKIDEERQALLKRVEEQQQQPISRPPFREELSRLEQALALKRSELAQLQSQQTALETQLEGRPEYQRSLKDRLAAIPTEREAVQRQLQQIPASPDLDILSETRRMVLLAERMRLDAEPSKVQLELALSTAEEAAEILRLRRQVYSLQIDRLRQEIQLFADAVITARRANAQARLEDVRKEAELARNSNEPWEQNLAELLDRNAAIIEIELDLQLKSQRYVTLIEQVEKERRSLEDERDQIERREGRTGSNRFFGKRLREQRKMLPDPAALRREVRLRQQAFEDAQLQYYDLREDYKRLEDYDAKIELHLREFLSIGDYSDDHVSRVQQRFRNAYERQLDFLGYAITAFDRYIDSLDSYDAEQLRLARFSEEFASYIDQRVLWIRSHEPLNWERITGDLPALGTLIQPAFWSKILSKLYIDFWKHPITHFGFVLLWSYLVLTQGRQTRRIVQAGKKASSRLNTSFQPTAQALLFTLTKSLILPLPIAFIGWRLYFASLEGAERDVTLGQVLSMSWNLLLVSTGVLCMEFLRNVHREHGLAQAHFGWPETVNRLVHRKIKSFITLVLPLAVLIAILNAWKANDDIDAFPRLFSIAIYLLLAILLYRITHTQTGVFSHWLSENRNGWIDRSMRLVHGISVAIPLAMAALSSVGFTYATNRLAVNLAKTLLLLVFTLFLKALLFRWLTLRKRRLAIERARQARAAFEAANESADPLQKSLQTEIQDQKSDLAEVSSQAKRLLNTTIIVLALVCVWLIWLDVLPALQYFDDIKLPGTELKLPSLISAFVLGILAATASRNVPGLLQITLLEWLPLEKSSRYAIGAVVQYIIAIFGLWLVSSQLQIKWEHVQWLAAALTFGLGFGLQEIFANFVSGLIILFEQPVRVGDVVTIDGVSGSVTKIRIRSTTITDWDRKEYIVPNKEFITGRLLNWTLTDTMTRIVIEVGVAYGTDPVKVHGILTKIVGEHPNVLKDPPPLVTFDAFGESSLNFTARAFLPMLSLRMPTLHELNIAINTAFKEADIEIPFPQRDLHIRSTVELPFGMTRKNVRQTESEEEKLLPATDAYIPPTAEI